MSAAVVRVIRCSDGAVLAEEHFPADTGTGTSDAPATTGTEQDDVGIEAPPDCCPEHYPTPDFSCGRCLFAQHATKKFYEDRRRKSAEAQRVKHADFWAEADRAEQRGEIDELLAKQQSIRDQMRLLGDVGRGLKRDGDTRRPDELDGSSRRLEFEHDRPGAVVSEDLAQEVAGDIEAHRVGDSVEADQELIRQEDVSVSVAGSDAGTPDAPASTVAEQDGVGEATPQASPTHDPTTDGAAS